MESWQSFDIPNLDIALPNYLSFCCDRNCHGSGIVVFVKSHIIAFEVYVSPKIEFLLLSINLNHYFFSIGTNYQPSSPSDDLNLLLDELTSLNPSIFSNLILLGDFHTNFFSPSSSKTKLDVISDTFNLKQIVNAPTHFSHTDTPSTIDFVFLPSNIDASSCSILPSVSSSDHFSILFSLPTDSVNSPSPSPLLKVWLDHLGAFEYANAPLTGVNYFLCQILMSSWTIFKELFLHIMMTTVLSKLVYPAINSYLPWINCSLFNHIKIRNSIFSSAK